MPPQNVERVMIISNAIFLTTDTENPFLILIPLLYSVCDLFIL